MCGGGLAVLKTIAADDLLTRADMIGKVLSTGIEGLGIRSSTTSGARVCCCGVVLTQDVAPTVEAAAREAGYLVNAAQPGVIRLGTPLILTEEQAEGFVAAAAGILDTAAAESAAGGK